MTVKPYRHLWWECRGGGDGNLDPIRVFPNAIQEHCESDKGLPQPGEAELYRLLSIELWWVSTTVANRCPREANQAATVLVLSHWSKILNC